MRRLVRNSLLAGASAALLVPGLAAEAPASPPAAQSPYFQPERDLSGIAAVSSDDVWAVGDVHRDVAKTFIEHYSNGQWRVVPSPNPGGAADNTELNAVAAESSNDVWAVGGVDPWGPEQQAVITHWDGTSWRVIHSPRVHGLLFSVAAVSPTNAWAVGDHVTKAGGVHVLIEHWNGSDWSVVKAPNPKVPPKNGVNSFAGVSVGTASDIWAVGSTGVAGDSKTLAEHWDGTTWSIVSTPNPRPPGYPQENESLFSALSLGPTNAWAVGGWVSGSGGSGRAYILHWDGSTWTKVFAVHGPIDIVSELFSIAADSPSDIWAVGSMGLGGKALTFHWDGTTWKRIAARRPQMGSGLLSVSVLSPDDAWAAGQSFGRGTERALLEHWDGTTWSLSH